MSRGWFEELKYNVEEFLNNATDDEIRQALKEADSEHYQNVVCPIVDIHEQSEVLFGYNQLAKRECDGSCIRVDESEFDVMSVTTADDYRYNIAA